MQISLYLLRLLQFWEIKSANKLIFTVLFAIWRDNEYKSAYIYCAFCNFECSKVQQSWYLLCFLKFGVPKSAKTFIFAVLFAIWRAPGPGALLQGAGWGRQIGIDPQIQTIREWYQNHMEDQFFHSILMGGLWGAAEHNFKGVLGAHNFLPPQAAEANYFFFVLFF